LIYGPHFSLQTYGGFVYMNKLLSAMALFASLAVLSPAVIAAELLNVTPVISEQAVSVEISADKPMTYTYYKVPGQTRAVVDIAEADPENVEPLIVVNKGVISSISVDKAEISGMIVSRIIFNLVSEANIAVTAAPDRKLLTVSFSTSGGTDTTEAETEAAPAPQIATAPTSAPDPAGSAATPETPETADDPLGLDEAESASAAPATERVAAASAAVAAAAIPAVSEAVRIPKLEPVVPATIVPVQASPLTILDVATGADFIELRVNQPVADFKAFRMSKPERLVIDMAGEKINQRPRTVAIGTFGISKVRVGVSPQNIRVVLDSNKSVFPAHTISRTEEGVRITFK
jgi:type IV pilus assembly protein PilQ